MTLEEQEAEATMLRIRLIAISILIALSIVAPAAMAAGSDDDYKAEAAIRTCAGVIRSQGHSWFRADYDRGKKTVQTNIQPGEQEGVISPFEQCLMSQGVFIQLPRH